MWHQSTFFSPLHRCLKTKHGTGYLRANETKHVTALEYLLEAELEKEREREREREREKEGERGRVTVAGAWWVDGKDQHLGDI